MTILYQLTQSETGSFTFAPIDLAEQSRVRLDVPWLGQNVGNEDDWSNSDCGPAGVTMWLRYRHVEVTINRVSQATGLARGYRYTIPSHLIQAAQMFGLSLKRVVGLNVDLIRAQIDQQQPVIVLVHYGSLPKRSDPNFSAGHFILVTGYDNENIIYHDSYWKDDRGRHVVISIQDFLRAMADCVRDGNTANQGLVIADA